MTRASYLQVARKWCSTASLLKCSFYLIHLISIESTLMDRSSEGLPCLCCQFSRGRVGPRFRKATNQSVQMIGNASTLWQWLILLDSQCVAARKLQASWVSFFLESFQHHLLFLGNEQALMISPLHSLWDAATEFECALYEYMNRLQTFLKHYACT